jgi:hypothetical protein
MEYLPSPRCRTSLARDTTAVSGTAARFRGPLMQGAHDLDTRRSSAAGHVALLEDSALVIGACVPGEPDAVVQFRARLKPLVRDAPS